MQTATKTRPTKPTLPTAAEVAAAKARYERVKNLRGADLDREVAAIRAEHLAAKEVA